MMLYGPTSRSYLPTCVEVPDGVKTCQEGIGQGKAGKDEEDTTLQTIVLADDEIRVDRVHRV
jgi:hypothetical protein